MRTPAGKPLSVNHVRRILSVKDVEKNTQLLNLAAKRGWSADRLAHEIAPKGKIAGRRPPSSMRAGPKPKRPTYLTDALVKLSRFTEEWLTQYESVWSSPNAWPSAEQEGEKDPADLARMVGEVVERLTRMNQSTDDLTERLMALKRGLRDQKTRRGGGKASTK